jgi:hypothetical protein
MGLIRTDADLAACVCGLRLGNGDQQVPRFTVQLLAQPDENRRRRHQSPTLVGDQALLGPVDGERESLGLAAGSLPEAPEFLAVDRGLVLMRQTYRRQLRRFELRENPAPIFS